MTDYVKTSRIAAALGISRKAVTEKARREKWPCVMHKGSLVFPAKQLPAEARRALLDNAAPESGGSGLSQLTDKAREAAINRSALIVEYYSSGLNPAEFLQAYNCGQAGAYLLETLGEVSTRTLYRWLREHRDAGGAGTAALAALAPRYGVKKSGAGVTLHPVQRALLRKFWLRSERPGMAHAWRQMLLAYPHTPLCTYQTAARFLRGVPPAERDYYRLGKKRFEDLYLPYVEQNVTRYKSLDLVVSDHHVLDCVVNYRGKLIRPWITTFQDYRSGKVVGFFPTVKPSSLSIIAAYYVCCILYGVPKAALFDNGKDYRSKRLNGYSVTAMQCTPEGISEEVQVFFQGVLPALGTEVHFTKTYSAKSKGRQERYFRILGEYLAKDIGSYIGSDTTTKPEEAVLMWRSVNGMAKREDVPTWEYFTQAAAAMITYINDTFASDGKGMDGKTRSRVFVENLPQEIKRVSKEELQQALYRSEVRKCGRNGISHHKVNYCHDALREYSGQDVVIRCDIVTDNELPVYTLDGRFICNAIANYYAEGDNLSQAIRRVESAKKQTLLALAERGNNETGIDADQRIMIESALRTYGVDITLPETLLGGLEEPQPLPMAAGAEGLDIRRPAKQTKYLSELDARPEQILNYGGTT